MNSKIVGNPIEQKNWKNLKPNGFFEKNIDVARALKIVLFRMSFPKPWMARRECKDWTNTVCGCRRPPCRMMAISANELHTIKVGSTEYGHRCCRIFDNSKLTWKGMKFWGLFTPDGSQNSTKFWAIFRRTFGPLRGVWNSFICSVLQRGLNIMFASDVQKYLWTEGV